MSSDPDVQAVFGDSQPAAYSDPDVQAAFTPTWGDAAKGAARVFGGAAENLLHVATGTAGALGGGLTYLGTLGLTGGDIQAAESVRQATQDALTYEPRSQEGKANEKAVNTVLSYLGPKEGEAAGPAVTQVLSRAGASPGTAAAIGAATNTSIQAIPMFLPGLAKTGLAKVSQKAPRIEPTLDAQTEPLSATGSERGAPFEPQNSPGTQLATNTPLSATGIVRRAPFEPQDIPGTKLTVDNEPVEGGLPVGANDQRAQILARVGLPNARLSALSGNAADAATDFQLSRFDEPAGQAAKAQFDLERQTLANKGESIVRETGGTLGTDEDTLSNRGQTIAAPFDALREWGGGGGEANYAAADAKAEGAPVGKMEGVQALLKDPDFTETLLAKDQGGLLGSVQRQFERFQQLNPEGFTAASAENFRKWLNQVWTPENSSTIGKIKATLDDDVMKGAGEDIYGPARQLAQTEHQLFGSSGISKITDADPNNPLNRATPYEKIPDTLIRMPASQFDHVIRTLHSLPEELQPQAQAAISEIKAHLANKVYDAGSGTQGQWNAPAVTKVLKANSAKFQSAFEDQPQTLRDLADLDSAGRILKVNQSYPGAAAQAANVMKRGLLTRAISHVAGSAGGAAGSILGPLGAAGGAALGEAAGSRLAGGLAERSALKQWNARNVPLSELLSGKSQ